MPTEIKVPELGESIIEATIARWIKQEGEAIAAGEAVVELETDKVNVEVSAPRAGTLQGITHATGDTVAVGDVLAFIGEGGGQPAAHAPEGSHPAASQPQTAAPSAPVEKPGNGSTQPTSVALAAPSATPVAQRMAEDMGLDLARVSPTGPGGRVTKDDVRAFVEKSAAGSAPILEALVPAAQPAAQPARPVQVPLQQPQGDRREERIHMSRRRQTIARRLVEAQQTAAMLTTFNEIDMSAVMELRKRRREGFKERYGVDLGFMSFFVKACIGALKAFPNVNAEIQGDEIVLKHYYDIGVAIGAEEGLVVPVIRDADRMNFAGIEKAIRAFVEKTKNGTLNLEDLRGGTFTITNGGVYGSLMSTPILNPPQVGILGMHAIKDRPVVVDNQMVIRPMMYVALSYDHRMVDGREAVQFLVRVKELVEDPEALLFG
jgi:2-oxoglutarate dehydrogenase E2 component (dihydrolipoamide succinyltransferase)